MAFECRLLGVVRLSIIGRFVFLESAIFRRFVWDFSEIWICGLYIVFSVYTAENDGVIVFYQQLIEHRFEGSFRTGNHRDV